jgi:hypothetical protein
MNLDKLSETKSFKMQSYVREQLLKCGAGSAIHEDERKIVIVKTLNERGWVSVEVMPND